jgi:lipopolysaccharide transport system permease protein
MAIKMQDTAPVTPPALLIRPTRGLASLNLRDLWVYRELVFFMTWRDLKVRYKQTLLGAAWAILQPVMLMVVFTLLFERVAGLSSEGLPYPLFNFAALLPWNMFAHALSTAGNSLVANRNMLTKIYFPRMILPLASVLASMVDFLIAFSVLVGMMVYYHLQPPANFHITLTPALLALPLLVLLSLVTAFGVSLWLSALNVMYRDVGYLIPFLTQLWFFITPVVYSSGVVSGHWRLIYALNPMVGVVNGFRWALLGTQTAPGPMMAVSVGVALLILVSGLFYFRRMERVFADEI